MVGCARGTFECAGCLTSRLTNLRTAYHLSFGHEGGGSINVRSFTMKKPTPNPPEKAHGHPLFCVRPDLSTEEALSNASEILENAVITGHSAAEHMHGLHREQLMTLVQTVEMAQMLVEAALAREFPVSGSPV